MSALDSMQSTRSVFTELSKSCEKVLMSDSLNLGKHPTENHLSCESYVISCISDATMYCEFFSLLGNVHIEHIGLCPILVQLWPLQGVKVLYSFLEGSSLLSHSSDWIFCVPAPQQWGQVMQTHLTRKGTSIVHFRVPHVKLFRYGVRISRLSQFLHAATFAILG